MIHAFWRESESGTVPFRALLLSILAFSVPVLGVTLAPELVEHEQGNLLWLSALLPPFLLTYYRGWEGASIGLAAGMAAFVMTHLAILLLGLERPDYSLLLWVIGTYIVVCLGSGLLGELLRRERRVARDMALTDQLTGLPNHRHAAVYLEAAFSGAARGQPVSVVLFSLDQFEEIGERFGQETSEQVLRRFGAIVTELTRRMDLSARWSGQTFVSVLSRCKAGGAAAFTTRVLEELRADVFPWGRVTASAGIAEFENGMGSLEVLLAAADRALSAAIEAGGDRHLIAGTRAEVFVGRDEPRIPSTQRGSLRLESHYGEGFHLVPAPQTEELDLTADGAVDSASLKSLPKGRERLLVVAEDPVERAGVVRLFKGLGYDVIDAPDADTAIRRAESRGETGLLVVDLIMQAESGFSVVDLVHKHFGPQRVVYLAGHMQGEVTWRGAPGALVSFVAKPMYGSELATAVRELLDCPLPRTEDPAAALV